MLNLQNAIRPHKENEDSEPRQRINQEVFDSMIPSFQEIETIFAQLHGSVRLANFEFQEELVNKVFFPKGFRRFIRTVIG